MAAKKKRAKTVVQKAGVFYPIGSKSHRSVCCDCGLAHKEEFQVMMVIGTGRKPYWTIEERAWRDNKLTAQMRKKKKYECQPQPKKGKTRRA